MGIYLTGGLRVPAAGTAAAAGSLCAELWGRFIADVRSQAGEDTRIVVLAVGDTAATQARELVEAAHREGDARFSVVTTSDTFDLQAIAVASAIVVVDGEPEAVRAALAPIDGEIRRRVAADTPYLGIGAGAIVAAEKALIGGWRIGGVPVSPEEYGFGLDEVTVAQGLGLLDLSVVTAPAATGSLGRLVAATEGALVPGGIGIDTETALIIADGRLEVVGKGSLWQVIGSEHGVTVSTRGA
ncbi:peptidase S51 [Mycetocola saprophilus]|uniref:peptidase S51 n=1 Tax=Mycetocola saprophilus TaxID=76636 RepID=UPI003BF3D10C